MNMAESKSVTHQGLLVLISHSSKDTALALALIELLKAAIGLTASQIRCSSVDGYRLPVGVNTEGKLREEVNAAKVVIGLITPSSLNSYYVMFELGARWGADLFLAPLLAGVRTNELSGPLSLLNALSADSEGQLHQLVADISKQLGLLLQGTASYLGHISAVKASVDGIAGHGAAQNVVSTVSAKQKLRVTVSAEGTPPSQILKLEANKRIEASRVEYMLTSEACIASEEVSREGETVEIPVNDALLLRLWNTPRPDRHHYDHSGPAKIGITISSEGEIHNVVLPVQMESVSQNGGANRKLVGSKTFYDP